VAEFSDVKSYGFKLSENLFYAMFRVYRGRDGNCRMKTNKLLGEDIGIDRSRRTILCLKGVTYNGILLNDDSVRIHIPRDITSIIFNRSWLSLPRLQSLPS